VVAVTGGVTKLVPVSKAVPPVAWLNQLIFPLPEADRVVVFPKQADRLLNGVELTGAIIPTDKKLERIVQLVVVSLGVVGAKIQLALL